MDQRRSLKKDSLDRLSDFVVEAGQIAFRHTFEMIEAEESFCTAPPDIIDCPPPVGSQSGPEPRKDRP